MSPTFVTLTRIRLRRAWPNDPRSIRFARRAGSIGSTRGQWLQGLKPPVGKGRSGGGEAPPFLSLKRPRGQNVETPKCRPLGLAPRLRGRGRAGACQSEEA